MKNANLDVKLEDDNGVDDEDTAKSINQMPCHLGKYTLGQSKRLRNNAIREIDGFNSNNMYYGDTDSASIGQKHWFISIEKSFVGKSLGLVKNDYGGAGIFNVWFLPPKIIFFLSLTITVWFWPNAVIKDLARKLGWQYLKNSNHYQKEKPYLADFQLIELKHSKEWKYGIGNQIV